MKQKVIYLKIILSIYLVFICLNTIDAQNPIYVDHHLINGSKLQKNNNAHKDIRYSSHFLYNWVDTLNKKIAEKDPNTLLTIYFPLDDYYFRPDESLKITSNVHLKGIGNKTLFFSPVTCSEEQRKEIDKHKDKCREKPFIHIKDAQNVWIEGITVQGNTNNSQDNIIIENSFEQANDIMLKKVHSRNGYAGLWVKGGKTIFIDSCLFDGNSHNIILGVRDPRIITPVKTVHITNSKSINATDDGLKLVQKCDDIHVYNNRFQFNKKDGIDLFPGGTNVFIKDNDILDNKVAGIDIKTEEREYPTNIWGKSDNVYISDNNIFNNNEYGIKIAKARIFPRPIKDGQPSSIRGTITASPDGKEGFFTITDTRVLGDLNKWVKVNDVLNIINKVYESYLITEIVSSKKLRIEPYSDNPIVKPKADSAQIWENKGEVGYISITYNNIESNGYAGIYCAQSNVAISHNTIKRNATNPFQGKGGIYFSGNYEELDLSFKHIPDEQERLARRRALCNHNIILNNGSSAQENSGIICTQTKGAYLFNNYFGECQVNLSIPTLQETTILPVEQFLYQERAISLVHSKAAVIDRCYFINAYNNNKRIVPLNSNYTEPEKFICPSNN